VLRGALSVRQEIKEISCRAVLSARMDWSHSVIGMMLLNEELKSVHSMTKVSSHDPLIHTAE